MQLQLAIGLVFVAFADNPVRVSVTCHFRIDLVETLLFDLVMPYTFWVVALGLIAVDMGHGNFDEEPVFRTVRTLVRNSEHILEVRTALVEVVVLRDDSQIPCFQTQGRAEFLVGFDEVQMFAADCNPDMAMWQYAALDQDSVLDLDSGLDQV